jgi:hypothetical protein
MLPQLLGQTTVYIGNIWVPLFIQLGMNEHTWLKSIYFIGE